jgi:hypothetical protein
MLSATLPSLSSNINFYYDNVAKTLMNKNDAPIFALEILIK